MANGRLRVGDSIYLRRPRGVLSAGVEEPNAFVRVNGDHNESMLPATTLELRDGLDVTLLDGIGVLDDRPDRNEYDKMHVHADVAVIGSGPAGLAAAQEAASGGARVVLFEQDFELGGSLLSDPTITVAGQGALDYIATVRAELEAAPEVTVLTRTCVFGSYDNNFLVALEKRDDVASAHDGVSRQRLWHVTAGQVVLAVGAFERPIVFSDNDVPGVMLASAVKTYVERWAALPGRDVVLFTTNDSAYETVRCLTKAGARVTVVDARPEVKAASSAQEGARRAGLTVHTASAVVGIEGSAGVTGAFVAPIDDAGQLAGDRAAARLRPRRGVGRVDPQREPAQPASGPARLGRRTFRFRAVGRGQEPARGRRRQRHLRHRRLHRRRSPRRSRRCRGRRLPGIQQC